jgi:AraC-like DNA-binding protein
MANAAYQPLQPLADRLTVAVARLYAATIGSLEPVLRAEAAPLTVEAFLAGAELPRDCLERLRSRMVGELVIAESRARDRPSLRAGDWRVILYCLGSARTLREAITRCSDAFAAIDGRCGLMSMRVGNGNAELHLASQRLGREVLGCMIDLNGIAVFHGILGWLIGRHISAKTIALDHEVESFAALGLPDLGIPVLLDAGWTGFAFDATLLEHPVVRSTSELIDWPRHSFLFSNTLPDSAPDAAALARRMAIEALRVGRRLPSFAEVVERLGASPATIRRRFAESGTSYRQIKSSCRRELGLELLQKTELSVEQIAERLDFCDSDAFRSAFKQWVGITPSAYRAGSSQDR